MIRTSKCTCGEVVEWDNGSSLGSYNVGDFMKQTGWQIIFSFGGGLIQMCPVCYSEVKDLCEQIVEITKDPDISIGNIVDHKN